MKTRQDMDQKHSKLDSSHADSSFQELPALMRSVSICNVLQSMMSTIQLGAPRVQDVHLARMQGDKMHQPTSSPLRIDKPHVSLHILH